MYPSSYREPLSVALLWCGVCRKPVCVSMQCLAQPVDILARAECHAAELRTMLMKPEGEMPSERLNSRDA